MVIIAVLYFALVYLLFFRLKLLPWNSLTKILSTTIGVIILAGFLVGLQGLTPASVKGSVVGRILEIAPQVSGRVISVDVKDSDRLQQGDVLFSLDPTSFEAKVDETMARLELAKLRLSQYQQLMAADAGNEFRVQQSEAEVRQLEAALQGAKFDLDNTIVRAPGKGIAPRVFLEPGMQVSPSRTVMTFLDTDDLFIGAQFQQKALRQVKVGDTAKITFPALPGQVFESKVIAIPSAIGNAQAIASGLLPVVEDARVTRLYPIYVELPEDYPVELRKSGLSASVTIYTERAGVVGIVALALQWVSTSLDAII